MPRWLAAGTLAIALSLGCSSAPPRWSSARAAPPDPNRWERAACRRGEYPVEIDSRALASARMTDLRARRSEEPFAPVAAERILRERDAFDARCAEWLGMRASGDRALSPAQASGAGDTQL